MESARRLILIPQLPIEMRYQEWWPDELLSQLGGTFNVIMFGRRVPHRMAAKGEFSDSDDAIRNEFRQMFSFLEMSHRPDDILLHCDLSYPGLFHSMLAHRRPGRCAVICHASALNTLDVFASQRESKWGAEAAAAAFYDKVFVATEYHAQKLKLPNTVVLGALPNPPPGLLPRKHSEARRSLQFVSVARKTEQKVDQKVEDEIERISGKAVHRRYFSTWKGYYQFLDRARFMVITAQEETYGYQVVDALLRGCIPIAPRAYSYPELLPDHLLYDRFTTATKRAEQIITIANTVKECPPLVCDSKARGFWENLKKELLEW